MTRSSSIEVRIHYGFPRHRLDADAVWIVDRLFKAGHIAYLVGGCIRDLLTGLPPKDFDVATSARPNQIKRLFHSCRIIGRRFRLAHVWFGPKVIEVSTFRGTARETEGRLGPITNDNFFGDPDEDSMRRDFTINGLFYDVQSGEIIDYVGGLSDLRRRLIRAIGDPEARMIEDPVRMIRAVKFAARVDFGIEPALAEAIHAHRALIATSAPARVLEELFKILGSGAASATIGLLSQYRLLEPILSEASRRLAGKHGPTVYRYLDALDAADQGRRRHSNAVLLGCLLMPLLDADGSFIDPSDAGDTDERVGEAIHFVRESTLLRHLPRKDLYRLSQIFSIHGRLPARERSSARRVIVQEEFGDALALYRIGCEAFDRPEDTVRYWEECASQYPVAAHDRRGAGRGRGRGRGRRSRF